MTKHFSLRTMQRIDDMFDIFQTVISRKVVQFCTLTVNQHTDERFRWAVHPNPDLILSPHYWTIRFVLQSSFKNHIIGMKELSKRPYSLQYFLQRDLADLYKSYFRIPIDQVDLTKTTTLPQYEKRNIFVYCEEPEEDQIYGIPFFKLPNINKVICFPKDKPIKVSSKLQNFSINNSLRMLPMADLSVQSMIKYVCKNKKGNILINQLPDRTGKYILSPKQQRHQPLQMLFMCDQKQYSQPNFKAGSGESFMSFKDAVTRYVIHDNVQQDEQHLNMLNLVKQNRYDERFILDRDPQEQDESKQ